MYSGYKDLIHVRFGLGCLVLAVLPAPGQVESVAVYTGFQKQPPQTVLESMQEEVAAIMAPGGLRLNWRSLDRIRGEVFSELAVARFKGNCAASGLMPASVESGALAWSHVSDGVVLPFADVDCDRIQVFLQHQMQGLEVSRRERIFGRAMGRVLAHELYHIFARAQGHGSRDVDKPAFTAAELVADDFGFDDAKYHILQLARQPAPAAKDKAPRRKTQPGLAAYVKSGCGTCHGSRGQGSRHGPSLRPLGEWLDSVILAAKLERGGPKMCKRARNLKVPAPVLAEEDIREIVRFLNSAAE
ncbi:conserved hypothetical protein [Candidatus Sulfopaludibacter sp. SbA4]|nr:conserved hypothetical protein [Candidatus Sulfopaludibacter sp. SbA4]